MSESGGGCTSPDHHFLIFCFLLLAAAPPTVLTYFLGDTKAVLRGCEDHWTLQGQTNLPQLHQMTLCVDIRVLVPGAWVAFSYSSTYAPKPDLGLEGDEKALYAWLLRVRHRFPIKLTSAKWHRLCLRRDAHRNSFSLELEGKTVAERTVYSQAIPASGSLWLGCRSRDQLPGHVMAKVELYLFRMWAHTGSYSPCEDGTVIGWDSVYWGVTSPMASETDVGLPCDPRPSKLCRDKLRSNPVGLRSRPDWRLSDERNHRGWRPQSRRRFRGGFNTKAWHNRRSRPNRPVPYGRSSITGLRTGPGWWLTETGPRSSHGSSDTNILISVSANSVALVDSMPLSASRTARHEITDEEGSSCICSAICNSSSQAPTFFVTKINVINVNAAVNIIQNLMQRCESVPRCKDYADQFKDAQVKCSQTLLSCLLVLELSAAGDACSLSKIIEKIFMQGTVITVEEGHQVWCGSSFSTMETLLGSNWNERQVSEFCRPVSEIQCEMSFTVFQIDSCSQTSSTTIQALLPSSSTTTHLIEVVTTPVVTQPTIQPTTNTEAAVTLSLSTVRMNEWHDTTFTQVSPLNELITDTVTDITTINQPAKEHTNGTMTVALQQNKTTTTQPPTKAQNQNTTMHYRLTTGTSNPTTTVDSQHYNTTTTQIPTLSSPETQNQNTTIRNQPPTDTTAGTTRHKAATPQTTHTTTDGTPIFSHETAFYTRTDELTNTSQPSITSAREQHNGTFTTTNAYVSQSSLNNVTASPFVLQTRMYNTTTVDIVTTLPTNNLTVNSNNVTGNRLATGANTATTTTTLLDNNNTTTIPSPITRHNESTNNYTAEYSQTTQVNNYTGALNPTTRNYTTFPHVSNTTLHNYTAENNTIAITKNYTTMTNYHAIAFNNHTTISNNHTIASNNRTTVSKNQTTTSDNLRTSKHYTTIYNSTTALINYTTPSSNYTTTAHNNTTSTNHTIVSSNHTTAFNMITRNWTKLTTSNNHTTINSVNEISSNHTTDRILNATVVPPVTSPSNQATNTTTSSVTTPSPTTDSRGNSMTAAAHLSKTTASSSATVTTSGIPVLPPTDTTIAAVVTDYVPSTSVGQTTNSEQSLDAVADDLLTQTQDVSKLDATQVARLVKQLEKLLEGPSVSESLGQKLVQVVSNLMEADPAALSGSANRLIQIVDLVGIKLSLSGDSGVLSAESLVLAIRSVDGTNFPMTSINIFSTNSVQFRARGRSRSKRSDSAMGSVILPPGLTNGLTLQQQQQASKVQFTFYSSTALFQDETLDSTTMVSPVLGSSVANISISNLTENVLFMIQNPQPIPENFTASCVFWDFSMNGDKGGWSSAGCSLVNGTTEATTCSCNHLTSFAILLDLPREGIIDPHHAQILTFITYIGCGVSAIFLAITLLTYLVFDKLMRDIPAKILVQLCFSLLLLNLVFLLDGWLALYPTVGLCISTAFFLHYFLLTSFTWTGMEAVHMYLSIVQVFTPYLSRYMLKFSLVGWGFPLIVVIIIIAVNKDNYGLVTYGKYTDGTTDDFCWLRSDLAFYVGVVAYFLLIFSVCVVVFVIVMVQLARIKKQNPHNQAANRGFLADARSITGLVVLLGLTWGFALFAWGPLYIPFVYLFTICNSLQGFLIFVFHCAVKENVRRQWRTYLCCGRLKLAENSDWSRTATQSHRHLSMNTNTSAPFSSSRTSSISDTNSGFTLVENDCTNDVVLNEVHRRALSPEREN